jgi:hypothetical protein
VYVPSLPTWWTGVVTKSRAAGNYYGIWISQYDQWATGGEPNPIYGSTVATGWSQVAEVQDGSAGTLVLYVNGVQVGSGPAQASNGTGPLDIGGDGGVTNYLNGTIDDVRLYNVALSASQVQSLDNAGPPVVATESPTSGATDVAVSSTVTATFNQAVQSGTISFTLVNSSGGSVAASVSYNSSTYTATLTPSAALAYNTTYTAKVSGAQNSGGTPMSSPFSWSFTTDPAPPSVSSESPGSGATNVAVSTTATATFNEAVQASTITFTLTPSGGSAVAASVSYNSSTDTATLTPSSSLAYSTTYTATVSGVKDSAGDPMTSPFSWTFTTAADPPPSPPTVTSETPASGATNVGVTTTATATFNQAVQSSTITFTLAPSGGSPVGATISYNSSTYTATLTPTAALSYSTTYTATVSGAQNSSGTPMSAPFSWTFTTAATPAPYVSSEAPAAGAQTNVGVSSPVTATFNEAVQSSTISFKLQNPSGGTISATVSYNSTYNTATLTPSSALAYSTTYTATVSGAQSSSGVPMTAPCTWSFTTAATSAPYVSSQSPMPESLNAALATVPAVTFNQAVKSSTIVFTLTNEFGTSVAGTVAYNSFTQTATFTPSAALAPSTTYTASVSGAQNSSGTAMPAAFIWEFITDPGAPSVTTESPSSNATGVSTTAAVTAAFGAPVQASSISFTLMGPGGKPVAASVSYNPTTFVATLTPTAPLSASAAYTAAVSGVQDVEGDTMAASASWSFTTAASPQLSQGLAAEWKFNEGSGTTTADNTGNGHNGTLSGSVSWVPGLTGPYALSFSSANSGLVTVPDSASLEFSATQSFSLTAWVYIASLPSTSWWTAVVTKSGGNANQYGIWLNTYGQWVAGGPNSQNLVGPAVLAGWTQVAVVQNGSANTRGLYLNGTQVASGSALAANATGNLCFGGDTQGDLYFNGTIADVRIYNRALANSEVQSLVSSAPPSVAVETPSNGAAGMATAPTVEASFTQPVQPSTINFTLTNSSGTPVPGTVTYNSANNTAAFTPNAILAYSSTYTATVSGAQNASGTAMPAAVTWSFTTAAAPGFAPSASTGEYIITDQNTIPNYAYNPTVTSVASGSWSSGSTWSTGKVPGSGALVSIASGTTVTYDANSTTVLGAITIQSGGTLQFSTSVSTEVISGEYLVLPGGTLNVGTQASPVPASVTATIVTANQAINTTFDPSQYGDSLIALGNVTIYGAAKTPFVQLAVAPQAGATTLYLAQPATGWVAGDVLFLPDTRQLDGGNDPASGGYVPQQETATIASISPNGLVVTLTSALQYTHAGQTDSKGNLTFLPQVVDETRNVVIRSQSSTGYRGIVMFLQRANININSAAFLGLGTTTDAPIDDTTFNSSGQVTHIGTNQQDRTPVDFLDLWGTAAPQANGYQFTFSDNVVHCIMESQDHVWGIEVNNSSYGLIQGNFVDNWNGAGIALVTGSEVDNMIAGNFVAEIDGSGLRDRSGLDGTGYWSPTPDDSWFNNVATDINPSGTYSYGFTIDAEYVGNNGVAQLPTQQGADPMLPGQSIAVNMYGISLVQFSGNETYGATQNGLDLWALGTFFLTNYGNAGVVQNLYLWNIQQWGYFGYETNNLTFDGFIQRGDPSSGEGLGMWFADYPQSGLIINNADIQGYGAGIIGPAHAYGQTLVENSFFSDLTDVDDVTTGMVSGASGLPNKSLVLQNDGFSVPSGYALNAIDMYFDPNGGVSGNLQCNLTTLDQVFVYSYNQNSANNYQVYYTQQAASTAMLQTGYYYGLIASPVSGMSNQQNWSTYGIATAGAVAPSSATTMTGITGLVVSIPAPSVKIDGAKAATAASSSTSTASSTQNTIAPMQASVQTPSAPTGTSFVLGNVDPATIVPPEISSNPVDPAPKAQKSRTASSAIIAGPLDLMVPRRTRIAQTSASSARPPLRSWRV